MLRFYSLIIKNNGIIIEVSKTTCERRMKMDKWVCGPCGYVYDPVEGDADGGIAPGTAFEDLPEDWVCPVCGATKDMFEKE
jgi:rubredoxin